MKIVHGKVFLSLDVSNKILLSTKRFMVKLYSIAHELDV